MPDRFGGQFDVVLNRGGGNYKYVGAWETENLPSRDAMRDAMRQWVACLRPGGTLYIDFAPESLLEHQQPAVTVHPTLHIGGHVVDITEQIAVDLDLGVRYWRSELRVDQNRYSSSGARIAWDATNFRRCWPAVVWWTSSRSPSRENTTTCTPRRGPMKGDNRDCPSPSMPRSGHAPRPWYAGRSHPDLAGHGG